MRELEHDTPEIRQKKATSTATSNAVKIAMMAVESAMKAQKTAKKSARPKRRPLTDEEKKYRKKTMKAYHSCCKDAKCGMKYSN
jgi:reverse gyrase